MKRTIFSLLFGVGLVLLSAADASAHEVEYRPYYVQHDHAYARTKFFPAWLKTNRQFQRWYMHSRYRFERHIGWPRLYDIYRFERRHRWHGRAIYDKVYRDPGYRPHHLTPKRHRH